MATKRKNTKPEENQTALETWRKPLQVPPRANAMSSFYRGADQDNKDERASKIVQGTPSEAEKPANEKTSKTQTSSSSHIELGKQGREAVTAKLLEVLSSPKENNEETSIINVASVHPSKIVNPAKELSKRELSEKLGIEIEDLFDVHELLRGKSFEIYQTLIKSKDEAGRCKITQPELMRRTGIKNRRTFYKHEEWLIKLNLLEKRHLPGDHKGVVYRVLEISDVLPLSNELLSKFKISLHNVE